MKPLGVGRVSSEAEVAAFLALPARLSDLGWSVALRIEQAWLFDARRNGFLDGHRVERFLAWRDGVVVGRIAACVPDDLTAPATFGFLCCTEDQGVVSDLLAAAGAWIAAAGRNEMLGPLSFSINHEVGALVDGFGRAPMLHMPRTPQFLPAMFEAAGLVPVQDVLACTLDLAEERHRARFEKLCAARSDAELLTLRQLDRRVFGAELADLQTRYNAAWAHNWGAQALGKREVQTFGALLRPLLWRGEILFADWGGVPAGLLSIVPNIEPALPTHGRLTPAAALRMGLTLLAPPALGGATSARIPLLGLLPRFRGTPAGAMVLGGLLARALDLAVRRHWQKVEISWILQHNAAMLNAMARLPAPVTGRWRLWRGATYDRICSAPSLTASQETAGYTPQMPPHDALPEFSSTSPASANQHAAAPILRPRAGPRRFLFLQGPISPFFQEVAQGLRSLGHAVHRINLSLGDKLFWRGLPAEDFTGRPEAWPDFIAAAMARHGITDLILLGEQRDYHRVAIRAAHTRGIFVTVTDFGYFRPDWITLEADGMGGDSRFPRDPAAILALAATQSSAALDELFRDSFPLQAAWDVGYHLANQLPWPLLHYDSHHLNHPMLTYIGVAWRLLRRRAEYAEGAAAMQAIGTRPYWLFAMQMETDFSLRAYSTYDDLDTPLRETLASFARNAPTDGALLIKVHPLDPCLKRWRRRIAKMAGAEGVAERVFVVHQGLLGQMIIGSQGLITVNSTVGLRAVIFSRPVLALGQAVWDVAGLAHQGSIDSFWSEGAPPDPTLREAFLRALQGVTQLRGLFYGTEGRKAAVAGTVARLHADTVGVPDALSPTQTGEAARDFDDV